MGAQMTPKIVWTLTEERKRAGLAGKKYLMGLDLNLRRGKNETEVSFPHRFSIAPDEQPVPAIGLESSS
jgi:hypothetical protein